jgi:hypothetical protein
MLKRRKLEHAMMPSEPHSLASLIDSLVAIEHQACGRNSTHPLRSTTTCHNSWVLNDFYSCHFSICPSAILFGIPFPLLRAC